MNHNLFLKSLLALQIIAILLGIAIIVNAEEDIFGSSLGPATAPSVLVPEMVKIDSPKDLPPTAVKAVDVFNAAEAKMREEYLKKLIALKKQLMTELERSKVQATKDGKLEAALAVKSMMENLEKEMSGGVFEEKKTSSTNSVKKTFTLKGKWLGNGRMFIFSSEKAGLDGNYPFVVVKKNENEYKLVYGNNDNHGWNRKLVIDGDNIQCTEISSGITYNFTKVEE